MQEEKKNDVNTVEKNETVKSDSPEYLGKVRSLVHEGQGRGFVTHRDIERHIPIEVWDPDTLDSILSNLQELGIEVVEEEARGKVQATVGVGEESTGKIIRTTTGLTENIQRSILSC